jgi:uncharacterized protein YegP (UPF0339 family)
MSPAELVITEAMAAVEQAGASTALTEAITLLSKARSQVADHLESIPFRADPKEASGQEGFFSIKPATEAGKFDWVFYAFNFREIARSPRSYNQKSHAADAARRYHRLVSGASFHYGEGFKNAR